MILKLLVARWQTTKESTTSNLEIRTKRVKTTIDQEVFLFRSKCGKYMLNTRFIFAAKRLITRSSSDRMS
jgi:hypothetical protein